MSKGSGWVPIDINIVKTLHKLNREFSVLEAMFSFSVDENNSKEWSINGYAKQWQWSRGKVRRFVNSMRTGSGHIADRKGTGSGHPIHFIDRGLWGVADRKRTGSGQEADRKRDTTIYPNPNPNPKNKKESKFNPLNSCPDFIGVNDWNDIIKHRQSKKATNSERAYKAVIKEIKCAIASGFTVGECVDEWTNRGWSGFKAEWMPNKKGDISLQPKTIPQAQALMRHNIAKAFNKEKRDDKNNQKRTIEAIAALSRS